MAIVIPITGYVTKYGLLDMHKPANNRWASNQVRQTVRPVIQVEQLPDGRVLDLSFGENTIFVPVPFRQKYYISVDGAVWLKEVLQYIDNNIQQTITFQELDGTTYTALGRMALAMDVSPYDMLTGEQMEIECEYVPIAGWA